VVELSMSRSSGVIYHRHLPSSLAAAKYSTTVLTFRYRQTEVVLESSR